MLELSAEALAAIYAHAVREYPRECCGVVYQDATGAWEVREGRNIQDDLHAEDPEAFPRDGRTAYHLDVASLFELSRSLQSDDPARLVYHSHCDAGAYFSASDQAAAGIDGQPAYPVEHLVVDVRAEGVRGAVRFGWDGSAGAYVEMRRYAR